MKGFRWRRALSIARKESMHVRRDPFTLAVGLGLPALMVLFFGYAINFDVRNVDLLASDNDHSRVSRDFLNIFQGSDYFRLRYAESDARAMQALASERAKAALIIPPNFGRDLRAGRPVQAQVLLDGADNQSAGIVASYLIGVQESAVRRLTTDPLPPAAIRTRFLFNPELDSRWFTVPGLFVIIVGLISMLLTALTVAREWESGSMELLLATPVRPLEIIIGKILPYLALSYGAVALVYLAARAVFGVPFAGSHALFFLATTLFLAASMSQGLIISVMARQQQLAFQGAMNAGMMPIQLLSGFIFPIISMPLGFQILTMMIPARWYMTIARSLFLRAPDLRSLALPMAALAALSLGVVALALRRFKTDLEP